MNRVHRRLHLQRQRQRGWLAHWRGQIQTQPHQIGLQVDLWNTSAHTQSQTQGGAARHRFGQTRHRAQFSPAQALCAQATLNIKRQTAGLPRRHRHGAALHAKLLAQESGLCRRHGKAGFVEIDAALDVLGHGRAGRPAQVHAFHGGMALQAQLRVVGKTHLQSQRPADIALRLGLRQSPAGHPFERGAIDELQKGGRRPLGVQGHRQLGWPLGQVHDGHLSLGDPDTGCALQIRLDRPHLQRQTIETQGGLGLLQAWPRRIGGRVQIRRHVSEVHLVQVGFYQELTLGIAAPQGQITQIAFDLDRHFGGGAGHKTFADVSAHPG